MEHFEKNNISGEAGAQTIVSFKADSFSCREDSPAAVLPQVAEMDPRGKKGAAALFGTLISRRPVVSATAVNLVAALLLVCGANISFWQLFATKLGLNSVSHWAFFVVTGVAMCLLFNIVFSLISCSPIHKPLIISVLCIASIAGYFMQSYGIVIDTHMITNLIETDTREATEQLTWPLFNHVLILGIIPSIILLLTRISYRPWKRELLVRSGVILGSTLLLLVLVLVGFKQLVLFGRENRDLRMYINPTYPIYSVIKTFKKNHHGKGVEPLRVIAPDAIKPAAPKRTAIVLVVGETARADEFSLNGYRRNTNPELGKDAVFSFSDVQSCGTDTAESVPCMFSHLGKADYSRSEAAKYENVLDVLKRSGVQVVWRDNNSGSKGVADRVPFEDLTNANDKSLCSTGECYDEILLKDLDRTLKGNKGDILVVLHQKGSHGPSYYKRTPKEFTQFLPQCTQDNVQDCDPQSIVNAYDNTILYTDHVLGKLIELLNSQKYATAMLYVSDHGESLGENNIYLHGLPYAIAPKEQTHVPLIFWASGKFFQENSINPATLKANLHAQASHDSLFHSLLGLFHVKTRLYRPELDLFHSAMKG